MSDPFNLDRRQLLALGAGAAAAASQATTAQAQTESSEAPDLSGKSILVTGASSGFGRLGVEYYASLGAKVFATMRNVPRPEADELRDLASSDGLDLSVIEIDVTSDEQVEAGVAEALAANEGKLDVLINNAGVAAAGISESFSDKQLQAMFDVNVFGLFRVTQAVLPLMRKHNDGLILNVGSILGRVTFPFYGLYGASKYAVEAITDSLSYELSQLGIDVVLVQPSAYPTNMYANAIAPETPSLAEEYGDVANVPEAIGSTIASLFESEDAPQPSDIANAAVTLVEQAKGTRPKRVVVGNSFGADAANDQIAPIQAQLIEALGLSSLETIQ